MFVRIWEFITGREAELGKFVFMGAVRCVNAQPRFCFEFQPGGIKGKRGIVGVTVCISSVSCPGSPNGNC